MLVNIDREGVNEHLKKEEISNSEVHVGKLDGVHFEVHLMKEPDNIMTMITMYRTSKNEANKQDNDDDITHSFVPQNHL